MELALELPAALDTRHAHFPGSVGDGGRSLFFTQGYL